MPADPPLNPPTVPVPVSGIQGVQGAQPVPGVRDPTRRTAGVPPLGQQPRSYPHHSPHPYAQPAIPVPQYGHTMSQPGRAAPMPAPRSYYPNPTGYQSGYPPNMNYGANPQHVPAQYRIPQNQVFQVPYPYQSYGNPGAPTAQPPQGSSAMQGREYSQQIPHRSVLPKVLPRASKAIAIIDPKTQQEIQITKADPKPAQSSLAFAQGSTASSKPVSNISDQRTAPQPQPVRKSPLTPVATTKLNVTSGRAQEPTKNSSEAGASDPNEAPVAADNVAKSTPTPVQTLKQPENTSPVTPVIPATSSNSAAEVSKSDSNIDNAPEGQKSENEAEEGVVTNAESSAPISVTTENTAEATPKLENTSKSDQVEKDVAPAEVPVPDTSTREPTGDVPAVIGSDGPEASRLSSASSSVTTAEKSSEDAILSEPAKRQRPPSPQFDDGGRRAYSVEWIFQMREYADPLASAKYDGLLVKSKISKSTSSSRGRSGGVLSDDPRRRAAPAPMGGFSTSSRNSGPFGSGSGGYDAFDMGIARRQPPPPIAGGSGSRPGRDDPRGARSEGPNRFDGPNRFGVGPLDPVMHVHAVEKLKKGENGWKRNKEADDEVTAKVKQVRSLLNKLTLEKFDKIFAQIIAIDLSSVEILRGVVDEVFEKTLFEPKFASMYAELCKRLDSSTREMLQKANLLDAKGKLLTFRKILLKNCQDEFTRFSVSGSEALQAKAEEAASEDGKETKDLSPEEKEKAEKLRKEEEDVAATKAKRRMLANVRFIGELYIKDLILEGIIHKNCVQPLLRLGISKKEEDVLEALCKLLANTGAKLSANPKAKAFVDGYFAPLVKLSSDHTLPARVRFMIQDLLEQRANNWKARREEAGAKKISEIHKDIEKEERAKAEAQAAARDRRGRGGGGGQRDRNRYGSAPVMPMTMAPSRQGSTGGMSRASAQLERLASRGAASNERFANRGANMQNVRLGPGGSGGRGGVGANGWKSMSGGGSLSSRVGTAAGAASLRPRSRNAFAALDVDKKESPASSSGDARRGNRFSTGTLGSAGAQAARQPAKPAVSMMSDEAVKRKAKSIVSEYWSIKDFNEAKACVVEEVKAPNYTSFLEMAIRFSMDGKMDQRSLSAPLFCGLLVEGVFTAEIISDAFSSVIGDMDEIEMDNPRAGESVSLYLGSLAATGKLGSGEDCGLLFLKSALEKIENGKRFVKFVIVTLRQYEISLLESDDDEKSRKLKAKSLFESLNIDLVGKIMDYNPMRGMEALEDLLSDNKMGYILPLLPVEKKLGEMVSQNKTGKEMYDALVSIMSKEDMMGADFTALVVRVTLVAFFSESTESISDKFSASAGELLKLCYGGKSPPVNVQMSVILEVQCLLQKKEGDFAALASEYEGKKYGDVAFEALYDGDVVAEDVFIAWKEDDKATMDVEGKPELLLQTSAFFQWLASAEVDD